MAYCPNCGAEVQGSFCAKCGSSVGSAPPPPPGGQMGGSPPPQGTAPQGGGLQDNVAAMLCYLATWITGLIFLLIAPYNQKKEIRFHAFQAIFISVAFVAIWIALLILTTILGHIPFLGFLGFLLGSLLYLLVGFGGFILWIYMMISAYNGKMVVLPVIGPMAQKQAGM